jgi:hypothetical protein
MNQVIDPELMAEAKKRAAITKRQVRRPNRVLKPEEHVFVKEFMAGSSLADCARAAGYDGERPESLARKWLERPVIQKKLDEMRRRDEANAQFSRDIYLDMLKDTYQKAMSDGDYSGANRAAELLGKALGYFVDQKAVLSVTAKMPEDSAGRIAEVQRLAKIAGVKLE